MRSRSGPCCPSLIVYNSDQNIIYIMLYYIIIIIIYYAAVASLVVCVASRLINLRQLPFRDMEQYFLDAGDFSAHAACTAAMSSMSAVCTNGLDNGQLPIASLSKRIRQMQYHPGTVHIIGSTSPGTFGCIPQNLVYRLSSLKFFI